jgi:hypothetical protein
VLTKFSVLSSKILLICLFGIKDSQFNLLFDNKDDEEEDDEDENKIKHDYSFSTSFSSSHYSSSKNSGRTSKFKRIFKIVFSKFSSSLLYSFYGYQYLPEYISNRYNSI